MSKAWSIKTNFFSIHFLSFVLFIVSPTFAKKIVFDPFNYISRAHFSDSVDRIAFLVRHSFALGFKCFNLCWKTRSSQPFTYGGYPITTFFTFSSLIFYSKLCHLRTWTSSTLFQLRRIVISTLVHRPALNIFNCGHCQLE